MNILINNRTIKVYNIAEGDAIVLIAPKTKKENSECSSKRTIIG